MIRMSAADFAHPTTSRQLAWNLSFVPCLCDLMKDGIRFSLIFPISHGELMEQITSKRSVSKFMQIAGSGAYIFQIVCILKKSYRKSLSFSFQSRNLNRMGHETMPEESDRSNALTGETLCTLNLRQRRELSRVSSKSLYIIWGSTTTFCSPVSKLRRYLRFVCTFARTFE